MLTAKNEINFLVITVKFDIPGLSNQFEFLGKHLRLPNFLHSSLLHTEDFFVIPTFQAILLNFDNLLLVIKKFQTYLYLENH